jgi:hypothetical protein
VSREKETGRNDRRTDQVSDLIPSPQKLIISQSFITEFVPLDVQARIAGPQCHPVEVFIRECLLSVESKSFGMRPGMSWFEPKRRLNDGFVTVMAIHFRCQAVMLCKTRSILLKSTRMLAHPDRPRRF